MAEKYLQHPTVPAYTSSSSVLENRFASLTDITLLLLGKTGSGKSSLGNVIAKRHGGQTPFLVTDDMYSTAVYEAVSVELLVHNRKIKVVDTPGVEDTSHSDVKALAGICKGITHCPEGVDAFLLVLRLDERLTAVQFTAVANLETLFGENFWRHVILVFTHGDCVNNDIEIFRQRLQKAAEHIPEFKALMSKLNANAMPQLVDASGTATAVVDKQIRNLIVTVDFLVKENKTKYTNELFLIAKEEIKKNEIVNIEKEKQKSDDELRRLRQAVSVMDSEREQYKAIITELEKYIKEQDEKLKEKMKIVDTKVAKESAKRKCIIL